MVPLGVTIGGRSNLEGAFRWPVRYHVRTANWRRIDRVLESSSWSNLLPSGGALTEENGGGMPQFYEGCRGA